MVQVVIADQRGSIEHFGDVVDPIVFDELVSIVHKHFFSDFVQFEGLVVIHSVAEDVSGSTNGQSERVLGHFGVCQEIY